jgi:predicted transcriptional regulator
MLLRSELKSRIIMSLLNGNKKLSELKAEIDTRETTILHVLEEFGKMSLTKKMDGVYSLTSLGIIEAQFCRDYQDAAETAARFKEFWLSHDISPIPPPLILRIGALKDSALIRTDNLDLGKVYASFQEILARSKRIVGISPIYHPDYVKAFEHLVSQGSSVELILSSAVLAKALSSVKTNQFKEALDTGALKIYLRENLRVALTVTESNFSLGLFNLEGEYDDRSDLVALSPEAIMWGGALFQEYLRESSRVTSKTFA